MKNTIHLALMIIFYLIITSFSSSKPKPYYSYFCFKTDGVYRADRRGGPFCYLPDDYVRTGVRYLSTLSFGTTGGYFQGWLTIYDSDKRFFIEYNLSQYKKASPSFYEIFLPPPPSTLLISVSENCKLCCASNSGYTRYLFFGTHVIRDRAIYQGPAFLSGGNNCSGFGC